MIGEIWVHPLARSVEFRRSSRVCYTPHSLNDHSFFVKTPEDWLMERETLEMDVVFVGAGRADLSGALHLARRVKTHNESIGNGTKQGKSLGEVEIAVIEKGSAVGA